MFEIESVKYVTGGCSSKWTLRRVDATVGTREADFLLYTSSYLIIHDSIAVVEMLPQEQDWHCRPHEYCLGFKAGYVYHRTSNCRTVGVAAVDAEADSRIHQSQNLFYYCFRCFVCVVYFLCHSMEFPTLREFRADYKL